MSLKRIIAYNVGYGDCMLLYFKNELQPDEKFFLLVDFGIRKSTSHEQLRRILKANNSEKNQKKLNKELLELVGNQIAQIVKQNKMSILISHFDEDHYNGIHKASALSDLKIQKIFVSTREEMPEQLNEFIKVTNVKIEYLQKANNYTIHQYSSGHCEKINILWPNRVFEALSSRTRQTFLEQQFQYWFHTNQIPPSSGTFNKNDTCLVFEVEGNNNKWCLFPGDANDTFNPYITNSDLINNPAVLCHLFPKLPHKYSFIKAPHHGTESWPLKAISNSCDILITMADSHDKRRISSEYFKNQSINNIYIMNCIKCDGQENEACHKCTVVNNKVLSHIEINL